MALEVYIFAGCGNAARMFLRDDAMTDSAVCGHNLELFGHISRGARTALLGLRPHRSFHYAHTNIPSLLSSL